MNRICRILAALFLLATVVFLPAAQVLAAPAAHPAGCHHRQIPSPTPAGHQCCEGNHQTASPTAEFSIQLLFVGGEPAPLAQSFRSLFHAAGRTFPATGDTSPRLIRLRI